MPFPRPPRWATVPVRVATFVVPVLLHGVPGALAAPVAVDDEFTTSEDAVLVASDAALLVDGRFDTAAAGLDGPWRYLDTLENENGAADPFPIDGAGRAWTDPDFDPSSSTVGSWKSGESPFTAGIVAALPDAVDNLGGVATAPDGSNLVTTYLFRNTITLTAAEAAAEQWFLQLLVDDGCIVHLNGLEVARINLRAGAINPTTLARPGDSSRYLSIPVDVAGLLRAGPNSIAVEVHQASLDSPAVAFDFRFDAADGFVYADDAFGTARPAFAAGAVAPEAGPTGGALRVEIGSDPPNNDPSSGAWRRSFTLPAPATVDVALRFRLIHNQNFEPVEFSEAVLAVDGVRFGSDEDDSLVRIYGNGNGGGDDDSGWRAAAFSIPLPAGEHTLEVGAYNNRSTSSEEISVALFDRISVTTEGPGGVLANDSGAVGLVAELVDGPFFGTARFAPDGTFRYTPNTDFHGVDVIVYRARDVLGSSENAIARITVASVNDPPAARPDAYAIDEDTVLDVAADAGLLANDRDVDSTALTAGLVEAPRLGSVTIRPDGGFVYRPSSDVHGSDSFTYRADDGDDVSEPATVTVDVRPVPDAPRPFPDRYSVPENSRLQVARAGSGATLAFAETFDAGATGAFAGGTDLEAVQGFGGHGRDGAAFAGLMLRNETSGNPATATSLTLSGLPPHDRVRLGFLLAIIGSWDGILAGDTFTVQVDGVTVFSEQFDSRVRLNQSYQAPEGGELRYGADLGFGGELDSAYDLSLEPALQSIPHSADDLTITWFASGSSWSGGDDESWAIDNVVVFVSSASAPETIVPRGAEWRYLDSGADLGTAWRAPGFDDGRWASGPAQLGYGDGDEATTVGFGGDDNDKFATTYFRRTFELEDPASVTAATALLVRDDGAAVFLNGTEIIRSNLAPGAGAGDFAEGSIGGADESTFHEFAIDPSLLVAGTNTLAVEIHQADPGSSDISFDLELVVQRTVAVGVLANDSDPDGDALEAALVTAPAHGTLALAPDGTFSYTPDPNFEGEDGFVYRATDGTRSAESTATITVNPGSNNVPIAAPDEYEIAEDSRLDVPAGAGLLANDQDDEGDAITAVLDAGPASGTLILQPDGGFSYLPFPDFHGTDSFAYHADDGRGRSPTVAVTVRVAARNDVPVATADAFAVNPGETLGIDDPEAGLLANDADADGDVLRAVRVDGPSHGTVDIGSDGTFSYTPAAGFTGIDSFRYEARDAATASPPAVVTVAVNARPVAAPDDYVVDEDSELRVAAAGGVLANDEDDEGQPLAAVLVTPPSHGVLSLDPKGGFIYLPGRDFSGTDAFAYTAEDAFRRSPEAVVTIAVTPVNDPPEARDDEYRISVDESLAVGPDEGLLANDEDIDSPRASLAVERISEVAAGTLELSPDGSFTYLPPAGFAGEVEFRYRVTDGAASSDPATVTLDVRVPSENVVLNEIMFHPPSHGTGEEFLELHNIGDTPIDLGGWRFTSGIDLVIPPGTVIPAGGFAVIGADAGAFAAAYGPALPGVAYLFGWSGQLGNRGERIRLVDGSGREVADLRYAEQGDWAERRLVRVGGEEGWEWIAPHDGGGSSLERIDPALPGEFGANWTPSPVDGPTPGARNAARAGSSAPLVTDVRHRPAIPRPGESVRVTARLVDRPDAGAPPTAVLHYRVSEREPGPFTQVPMRDDGDVGDASAGDAVFTGILPGFADGTVLEFFVEAFGAGGSRTWPPPTGPDGTHGANLLLQFDDEEWSGTQPIYRLVLTAGEEDRFVEVPGGPNSFDNGSDAQMNATFISLQGGDVDVRYRCGVRRRGASSRNRFPHNWRINFPHDDPWNGLTQINLNTQFTYLQVFGSAIHRAAGLPVADTFPVAVRLNGIDHSSDDDANRRFGLYAHTEVLGTEFVENHFPGDPEGNLYKKGRPDTKWAFRDGDVGAYLADGWVKQSNASEDDWSDLDGFLRTMNRAAGATYLDQVGEVADIDQWLRWFAVMTLLNGRETNVSNGTDDDYAMFRGVVDPRFKLIAHDLDTILGQGDTATQPDTTLYPMVDDGFAGEAMPQLQPLFEHPDVARRYQAALLELLESVFSAGRFDALIDNTLGGWVPQNRIEEMKRYMAARRAHVRAALSPTLEVDSDLPAAGGLPRTTDPGNLQLSGTIDAARTRRVLVNGVDVAVDPRSGTWSGVALGEVLMPFGTTWRYLDDGSDQGTAWRLPGFDDGAWPQGPARLGFGGDGELTEIGFGGDPDNKIPTTYFRTTFEVADPSRFASIALDFAYDDGFVVYLNGVEAGRVNLPDNGVTFATYTGEHQETTVTLDVPAGRLRPGVNTVAVELHQAVPDSADLGLDLAIRGLPEADFGLAPGINRVTVQALGEDDRELSRQSLDIWFDDGTVTDVGTAIAGAATWRAADGPFRVTDTILVPPGAQLTIEPGTNVWFAEGTRLVVLGRLVAGGDPARRVRLTRGPGSTGAWEGIHFLGTLEDNRLLHVDLEFASGAGQAIEVDHSHLVLEDVTWSGTTGTVLELDHPRLRVTGCTFPSADGSPVIHGTGLEGDEHLILERNTFASSAGSGDVVRFVGGRRPGPILQAYDNLFAGASDDVFDLDGADAHLEGNVFLDVHSGAPGNDDTSNAIAARGDSDLTIVRNVFHDVDHALLLVDGARADFAHNTVVDATIAAINFDEPARPGAAPGAGIDIAGSIFSDSPLVLENRFSQGGEPDPVIRIDASLLDASLHGLGSGNLDADPRFIDPAGDFRLAAGSPARGTGPNGLDMGAHVQPGASIAGEPRWLTANPDATLTIAGPGITRYRFRLDDGAFGTARPASEPIVLTGLADGPHRVEVIGMNSAGRWQSAAEATISRTWTVARALQRVVLNEVLASNVGAWDHEGSRPDLIELRNDGATEADLTGWSLTDDPAAPARFVFPAGTRIPAGGFLVVFAGPADGTPGLHAGFSLRREGESLVLADAGGGVVDEVRWGPQVDDLSIARTGHDDAWTLAAPTPGAPNIALPTGDPARIVINEWLAANDFVFDDDFVELFNPDLLPVDLGGLFLTDEPVHRPARHRIPDLSFIPGNGFLRLVAAEGSSADHLGFRLSKTLGSIALLAGDGAAIDTVHYLSQREDVSQGRTTDGAPGFSWFTLPTPGLSNAAALDREAALLEHLRITEIMFNPPNGSEFEFLELNNTGPEPLDLAGLRFTEGIAFTFPTFLLGPGEYAVVVSDPERFRALYGDGPRVVGAFDGKLDNGGERLRLEIGSLGAGILDFRFDDDWFPASDGGGLSLVVADPRQARRLWDEPEGWRAGAVVLGTPGSGESIAVDAGDDRRIILPATAQLDGTVLLGASPPDGLALRWVQETGPGIVAFADASLEDTTAAFPEPGEYVLRLTLSGSNINAGDLVRVTVLDSFDAWSTRTFAGNPAPADPGADPDGDRLATLAEYGLGLDPLAAGDRPALGAVIRDGVVGLEYAMPYLDDADVRAVPEVSDDLGLWRSGPGFVAVTLVADDGSRRTYRATPVGAASPRFMRLRFERVVP